MKNIYILMLLLFATLMANYANAYDFSSVCSTGQTLYYNITSNEEPYTVEVTSENNSYEYYTTYPTGNLEIPETVEYNTISYSVTRIGDNAFYNCDALSGITIPGSVTSIGESALYGCSGLSEITIPNSVNEIGAQAFASCDGLTGSLTIPNTVTVIPNSTFYNCTELSEIIIPNSITSIGSSAFQDCSGLASITIPDSITSIGDNAFSGCTGLTTVNFNAKNCTYMGNSSNKVFSGCSSLTTLNIGERVKNIPAYAFYDCDGLTEVTIPDSVTSIGISAFYWCSSLGTVTIGENVESIGEEAFSNCSGITEITIPQNVTSIGDRAFVSCNNLATVNFNATNCTTMGSYYEAFYNLTSLTTLNIGENVKNIPDGAFRGCTGLTGALVISDSITNIGLRAFYGCSGLSELTIGSSVTSIGDNAFYCSNLSTVNFNAENCTNMGDYNNQAFGSITSLTTLNIGERVKNIPAYAFYNCSGLTGTLIIPDSVTNIGEYAFYGCSGLSALDFNAKNCTSIGDYVWYGCSSLTTLNIDENVTIIPGYAFKSCSGVSEVTIPDAVTSIGERAFSGCTGLNEITIPDSVTSIGDYAFYGCTGLTTVNFNAENCTTMGDSFYPVFKGCSTLSTLNIGENVKNIPDYAFYNCSGLTEITIPNNVTSIGNKVFYGCSTLATVNFNAENCTANGSTTNYIFQNCPAFTTLNIGEKVKTIPDYTFYACSGLTEITIPDSITSIGDYAFGECSGLTTVNFNATNCTTMGTVYPVFINCTNLTTLNIGENVKNIPNGAFYNCSTLTGNLTIPNSVTSIDEKAFYGCRGVETITIGDSIISIGERAFYNCSGLTTVNFNATNCTTMGSSDGPVFYSCTSLATLNIGERVKNIPNNAFSNCSGLTEITIPDSITSIGNFAFRDCSGLTTVNFNAINCTTMESSNNPVFYNCTNLSTVNIGERVNKIPSYIFYNCRGLTSLTIPESVTVIGNGAFGNCIGLTGELVIPNSVITIGSRNDSYGSFCNCRNLTSIIIGNSVEFIGKYAFQSCRSLTSITIPESVMDICDYAFESCVALTTVNFNAINCTTYINELNPIFTNCSLLATLNIGERVKSISNYVFRNCSGLTEITIPDSVTSIGDKAFDGCTGLTVVNFNAENCTTMGSPDNYVFMNCSSLETINIGERVKNIPDNAFYNCNGLTGTLVIPDSVTNIGASAFYYCSGYEALTLGKSVETIGTEAFYGCNFSTLNYNSANCSSTLFTSNSTITTITIGEDVETVPNNAFENCSALATVNYNATNCTSEDFGFYQCTAFTTLNIGDNVTNIPRWAFYNSIRLNTVTIPSTVESIGENAFYRVRNIIYNGSATGSPWGALTVNGFTDGYLVYSDDTKTNLTGCIASATSVTIPSTVTTIGENAFYNCSGLTEITIPSTVTSIGYNAFNGTGWYNSQPDGILYLDDWCLGYKNDWPTGSFAIQDGIKNICDKAFYACGELTELTIPNSVKSIGVKAFSRCTELTTVNFNAENCTTMGNSSYYVFGDGTTLTTLNIGERVKNIPDYAFEGCSGLTGTLTIPDSVTNIGTNAFYRCSSLATVTIGKNVESIGERAFSECDVLTTVNFNAENCTTMGSQSMRIFEGCTALATLNIGERVKNIPDNAFDGCSGLTGTLIIPDSVTNIGTYAFGSCSSIDTVAIGNSVETIGESAFYNCSGITSVAIGESVETIDNYAFHYCDNIAEINTLANTPPELLGDQVFSSTIYPSATLWTPCTLDEVYRNDSQWGQFTNIQNDTAANLVVEVQTADADMGSVTGEGTFSCETEAIITATPNQGYRFLSWNDGNEDNPRTIVVTKDSTFTAGFKAAYIITATAGEGGTITPSGETTVDEGGSQSFTITPNECYAIASVTVDGEDVTADLVAEVYTFDNVTTGHTISATFEQITYTIAASAGNGGTITPAGDISVNCGEGKTFAISANEGYMISDVLVDGQSVGSQSTYTFSDVTANHTISATFDVIPADTYTITATAGVNGTITPSGSIEVEAGSDQAFLITPDEHYRIASVMVDGEDATNQLVEGVYTFENVTANHTIYATFDYITYSLTIHYVYADNETAAGDHFEFLPEGATYSVISPEIDRYTADQLIVEGTMPAEDVEITVTYTINTYTITATAGEGGIITPEGVISVEDGDSQPFEITANEGYRIASVIIDGETDVTAELDEVGVYIFENVTSNHTIDATFEAEQAQQYTITVLANNDEYGSVEGGGTYNAGDTVIITAIPNEGYHFVSWNDENTENPRTIMVTGDSTFVATFAETIATYTITAVSANEEYGTVTGGGTYEEGSTTTLIAMPYEGYVFVSWNGDNTDNPRTITVTSDSTFVAIFDVEQPQQYTITVLANNDEYGMVSGGGTYEEGATATLTAIPNQGYRFVSWSDDNTENPRTIIVTSDSTFVANF
ncbi:MAG: leucine-rich repeat domain-containing protein, partial [Bacteroidales bacterium]|nr:leucine-rich repeat domain-containing protein [Bacteroidales bacterium]